jgi:hypothetical protein
LNQRPSCKTKRWYHYNKSTDGVTRILTRGGIFEVFKLNNVRAVMNIRE